MRWRSSATCTSSTARSSTACSPTATRPRRSARRRSRSRRWPARAGRPSSRGSARRSQQKIITLLDTGTTPATERLRAKFPPGLIAITRLPGLGPKRARLLFTELGIDSPEKLREAALAQRLRTVKGLGAKFEDGVLAALERIAAEPPERAAGRLLLPRAIELGETLAAGLIERGGPGRTCRSPDRRGGWPTA